MSQAGPPEPGPETPGNLEEWTWTIGRVVGAFGLRGEVKVYPETDFPERFLSDKILCFRTAAAAVLRNVRSCRFHKGRALLALEDVSTLEEAEALRGALVQVPRSRAAALQDDSFFQSDLIGMRVVTAGGDTIGTVDEVLRYPAQDLLRVGDALIPAVKPIVQSVDIGKQEIVIDPPRGLLGPDESDAN